MFTMRHFIRWMPVLLLALAGLVMLAGSPTALGLAAEKAIVIPPPAADEAAGQKSSDVAVLAGGCFWGCKASISTSKG